MLDGQRHLAPCSETWHPCENAAEMKSIWALICGKALGMSGALNARMRYEGSAQMPRSDFLATRQGLIFKIFHGQGWLRTMGSLSVAQNSIYFFNGHLIPRPSSGGPTWLWELLRPLYQEDLVCTSDVGYKHQLIFLLAALRASLLLHAIRRGSMRLPAKAWMASSACGNACC